MCASKTHKQAKPADVIIGTGGRLSIAVNGTVMQINCHGAWNETTAKKGYLSIIDSATGLVDKPWAVLMNLEDWAAATPEAGEWIMRASQWMRKHNLVRNATITGPHVFAAEVYQRMLAREPAGFQLRVFDSEAEGWAWLLAEGFGPQEN